MLNQVMGSNPQFQQVMKMVNSAQSNGVPPQQLFYNLAKEKGMTEEQIAAFVKQNGVNS